MSVIYVASDREGAGKTALCASLADRLRKSERSAVAWKPVTRSIDDRDGKTFETLLVQPAFGEPTQLDDGALSAQKLDEIKTRAAEVGRDTDVLLVEGAVGLDPATARQLIDALDAKVIVVVPYGPDLEPSHVEHWRELADGRLAGFVINGLTRYRSSDVEDRLAPALATVGLPCFGAIPEERRLLALTVGQVADLLDGRFLACEDRVDSLVEHFMVGGWMLDPAELVFGLRENKAVIARGDRPDIQMAALETPTACIVLTEGIAPIEYVQYEAEQTQVPLIVTDADTLTAMETLDGAVERARFDHPAKLQRFGELVDRHLDLSALFAAGGVSS